MKEFGTLWLELAGVGRTKCNAIQSKSINPVQNKSFLMLCITVYD